MFFLDPMVICNHTFIREIRIDSLSFKHFEYLVLVLEIIHHHSMKKFNIEKSAEKIAALLLESASGSAFFFLASERERVRHFLIQLPMRTAKKC